MDPAGPETRSDSAGKGQQQFTTQSGNKWQQIAALQQMRHLLKRANPSSRQRGGHISKHISGLSTKKNWWWVPKGPETNYNCAEEGQQQFLALLSDSKTLTIQ
jgi:hypothetical protein